ncbi:hypothetical protein ACKRLN_01795 [Anaerococcus sp. DFU013_CI05]|uniref:hypothetical protein n=1 Tax=Anaerococcus sp. AH8042_DFU013_CI05 TaxID=3385202 RepID=UPI003A5217C6
MKTKEFIERVKQLGLHVEEDRLFIRLFDYDSDEDLAVIFKYTMYNFNTLFLGFRLVNDDFKKELFDLLVEYASTPIEEREEEKKFYLRHRWAKTKNGNWLYMALRKRPNISYLTLQGSNEDVFEYKVRFTKKEIEDIKFAFDTDLYDFKEVEVEE